MERDEKKKNGREEKEQKNKCTVNQSRKTNTHKNIKEPHLRWSCRQVSH